MPHFLLIGSRRIQTLRAAIEPQLNAYLQSSKPLRWNVAFTPDSKIDSVENILLEKDNGANGIMQDEANKYKFCYHFYMTQRPELRSVAGLFNGGGDDDLDSVIDANHILLPANEFVGLWDNLIYEEGLKEEVRMLIRKNGQFMHELYD